MACISEMDLTSALYLHLQKNLSPQRFIHSVSTAGCAKILAGRYGFDGDKAFFSGLVHDVAREMDEAGMVRLGKEALDGDYDEFYLANPITLHSFAGARILETEFGISDRSVLDAVKWHCSAHPSMDENAKIVYIADYIESTRKHISTEDSGRVLKMELDEALFFILCEEEKYYHKPGAAICPDREKLYTQLEQNRRHEK